MQPNRSPRQSRLFPLLPRLRANRILLGSTLFLLAFVALILTFFYATLRTYAQRSYLDSTCQEVFSSLEQTDSAYWSSLTQLSAQGSTLLKGGAFTGLMISDRTTDLDRLYDASSQLSLLCDSQALVSQAWLLLSHTQQTLSPDQGLQPLADSDCPDPQELARGQALTEGVTLCRTDSGLYLLQQTPVHNPLGGLVLKLDPSALYRLLRSETRRLYLYDQELEPVFSNLAHYPAGSDLTTGEALLEQPDRACYRSTAEADTLYFLYRSPTTGWTWLLCYDALSWGTASAQALRLWLPSLLAVALGAFALSLFHLNSLYRPIQKMLDTMLCPGPGSQSTDPFRSMGQAWLDTTQQNQALRQTLAAVAPSVTRQQLHRIFVEGSSDWAQAARILQEVGGEAWLTQPYLVLVIRPAFSEQAPAESYQRLYALHACQLAEQALTPAYACYPDETGDGRMLLAVRCAAGQQQALAAAVQALPDRLTQECRELPYQPILGTSHVCTGLEAMHSAYQEACRKQNHQFYYHSAPPRQQQPEPAPHQPWAAQVFALLDSAGRREQEAALEGVQRLFDRLSPQHDQAQALQQLHAALVEGLLARALEPTQLKQLQPQYLQAPYRLTDTAENRAYLRTLLEEAISLAAGQSQASRGRYLAIAKEYIAQHYTDPALSLDQLSQAAGISGPYLSTIFSEVQGQRFVDYLNHFRVEKAQLLLQATELSVTEVGFRTGFYSANSFIRVFKKILGETPGAYRTHYRQQG